MNIFCNVVVAWLWPPQQTSFLMHTQLTRSGYEFQNSCSLWKGSLQGRNWVILREGRRYIYNMKDEIIHVLSFKCVAPLIRNMSLAKVWKAGGGARLRPPPLRPWWIPSVVDTQATSLLDIKYQNKRAFSKNKRTINCQIYVHI